jgi:L-proline amide hydrolase
VNHSAETAEDVRTGVVPFGAHRTWYRVTGTSDAGRAPVVVLHGGPGLAHFGCLPMAGLAAAGRSVIHYDQLGCGNSTHLPDADPSLWTVQLFKDELANLLTALRIDRYHLVGHSWGGMLGAEFAVDQPPGLLSLTIGNSPASMQLWMKAADDLLGELPEDVRDTLVQHEAAGTTDSAAYREATDFVYARHFCRVRPLPDNVKASLGQLEDDPTVYYAMNGPSEFHVIGSLKDWTIVDRLERIAVPTLVLGGQYDEATPETWAPFVDRIPDSRAHVFPDASHTPHVEQPEQWLSVVGEFLRTHEAPPTSTPTTDTPHRDRRKAST